MSIPIVVDYLALITLVAIVALPVRVAWYLKVGGAHLHLEEMLELWMIALSAIKILSGGWRASSGEMLSIGIIAITIGWSQLAGDRLPTSSVALQQARTFLPFATAIVVVLAPWQISRRTVVISVCSGIAVSAILASLIHVWFRSLLPTIAVDHELLDLATVGGRMYWSGLVLSLLSPLIIFYSSRRPWGLALITLGVVLAAIALTQSRSVLIGFGAATVVCLLVKGIGLHRVAIVVGLVGVFGVLVAASLMTESELVLMGRRLGVFDFTDEFDRAFQIGRVPLYEQYWSAIAQAPLFGLGLGSPLALSENGSVQYSSDISVVHVMVPFGTLGVAALVWYVVLSVRRARARCRCDNALQGCKWVILLAACMSLNHDPFFRSMFPIAFSFILSASTRRGQTGLSQ